MDAEEDPSAVVRRIVIAAPAREVFRYFTEPARMMTWHARAATIDGTVGGRFRIDVNGRRVAVGEFVTIDPPHRVVFSWGWEGRGESMPPGSTTVEVSLREVAGQTEVTLIHRGLPAGEKDSNLEGWDHYLPRLKASVETGDAGPDDWTLTG